MKHTKHRILVSIFLLFFSTQTHSNNLHDYFKAFDEYSWWVKGPAIFAGFVGFYTVTRLFENSLSYLFKPAYIKRQENHERNIVEHGRKIEELETFKRETVPGTYITNAYWETTLKPRINKTLAKVIKPIREQLTLLESNQDSILQQHKRLESKIYKDHEQRLQMQEKLGTGGIFQLSANLSSIPVEESMKYSLWNSNSSGSREPTPRVRPLSPIVEEQKKKKGNKGKEKLNKSRKTDD